MMGLEAGNGVLQQLGYGCEGDTLFTELPTRQSSESDPIYLQTMKHTSKMMQQLLDHTFYESMEGISLSFLDDYGLQFLPLPHL